MFLSWWTGRPFVLEKQCMFICLLEIQPKFRRNAFWSGEKLLSASAEESCVLWRLTIIELGKEKRTRMELINTIQIIDHWDSIPFLDKMIIRSYSLWQIYRQPFTSTTYNITSQKTTSSQTWSALHHRRISSRIEEQTRQKIQNTLMEFWLCASKSLLDVLGSFRRRRVFSLSLSFVVWMVTEFDLLWQCNRFNAIKAS